MIEHEDQRLLLPEEVAKYLGLKPETLAAWRSKNKGPKFIRVGCRVRYRQENVEEWVEANLVDSGKA